MALKKFTSFVNEKQTDKELKTKVEKELASDDRGVLLQCLHYHRPISFITVKAGAER